MGPLTSVGGSRSSRHPQTARVTDDTRSAEFPRITSNDRCRRVLWRSPIRRLFEGHDGKRSKIVFVPHLGPAPAFMSESRVTRVPHRATRRTGRFSDPSRDSIHSIRSDLLQNAALSFPHRRTPALDFTRLPLSAPSRFYGEPFGPDNHFPTISVRLGTPDCASLLKRNEALSGGRYWPRSNDFTAAALGLRQRR